MNSQNNNDYLTEFWLNIQALTEQADHSIKQNLKQPLKQTGKTLELVAQNPLLQSTYQWIGLDWLMSILGEVDHQTIQATVDSLRQQYPDETSEKLANRIILQQGLEAAKIGLFTNLVPPFALFLFGLEFSLTTKLQVEMIYQIAAAYNLELKDPMRRGENFALYSLSLGGELMKTGLNIVEIIPGIGAILGASSNAVLLYGLGHAATWLYKDSSVAQIVSRTQPLD